MQLMLMPAQASDEDAMIRAAIDGDRGAFGELYVRYARMVHAILLARVPPGDAEDLVQDVFMSAMRQLRGLRTAASFKGWLGAIARNRGHPRDRRRLSGIELPGAVPNPDVSFLNDFLREVLPSQDTKHHAEEFRARGSVEALESGLIALRHRGNQPD